MEVVQVGVPGVFVGVWRPDAVIVTEGDELPDCVLTFVTVTVVVQVGVPGVFVGVEYTEPEPVMEPVTELVGV